MCYFQREGRTNSKNLQKYRPYHIGFKCGHCAECVREKRNEYLLRSLFESIDTINHDGYILFETLTYDPEHLPMISRFFPQVNYKDKDGNLVTDNDFSCFAYEDIRKFTNLLWTTINRTTRLEDYDVKQNIKFFLVSEYGHEDIYKDDKGRVRKGTVRPHYHCLFYVKDKRLHPGTLVGLIYDCWRRGETDNHRNGMTNCMTKNVIGKGYTKDKVKNLIAVSNYVSKYITKQADYMKIVENRINVTVSRLVGERVDKIYNRVKDYQMYVTFEDEDGCVVSRWMSFFDDFKDDIDFRRYYEKRKEVIRYISPFHRQSRGFGECALHSGFNAFPGKGHLNVVDDIMENMSITVPDSRFVTKTYNVPLYFMRKLFYRTVVDDEGKYHWVLNDLGKEKYAFIMQKKCDNVSDRLRQWYINLGPQISCFSSSIRQNLYVSCVDYLLDGRTMLDLAEYMVYYRGRIFDKDAEFVDEETGEIFSIPTIEQIIEFDKNYSPLIDTGCYNNGYNIVNKITRKYGINDILDEIKYGTVHLDYDEDFAYPDCVDDFMDESYKIYECTNVINEKSDYRFRNFDTLINMYYLSMSKSDVGKQAYFDLVEELSKKLKG